MGSIKAYCSKAAYLYLSTAFLSTSSAFAVDKIYHPYVEPYEREIDYRVSGYNDGDNSRDFQTHRVSFGYGVSEHVAVEAYLIGEKYAGNSLQLTGYEFEVLWQLNDQGSDWLDSAMIFEVEQAEDGSYSELSTGVVAEKELDPRWSVTANVIANYEFGSGVSEDFEANVAAQLHYRLNPLFEPAVETYLEKDILAIGPAALGAIPIGPRNQLKWEAAALLSAKHDIAARIFRASLEWEF